MARCFLGFTPPNSLQHFLLDQLPSLKRESQRHSTRWHLPGDWHITLIFLGEISVKSIASIQELSKQLCANLNALPEVNWHVFAGFPASKPKVYALQGQANSTLLQFHQQFLQALSAQGVEIDHRQFRPHLTLARGPHISYLPEIPLITTYLSSFSEIVLYESLPKHVHNQRYLPLWKVKI